MHEVLGGKCGNPAAAAQEGVPLGGLPLYHPVSCPKAHHHLNFGKTEVHVTSSRATEQGLPESEPAQAKVPMPVEGGASGCGVAGVTGS